MNNDLEQNISNNKSRIMKLLPYIFCFFIFSFLGWVLETLFCGAQGIWEKRGFLYSTICPIYRNWRISFNLIFR